MYSDPRREVFSLFVVLLLIALAVGAIVLAVRPAHGAPAPLPRRDRTAPTLPVSCVLRWHDQRFCATFEPGGRFADWREESPSQRWEGTWAVDRGTNVLTLRERYCHADGTRGEWAEYRVSLRRGWREGSFDGAQGKVNFVIEGAP